MTVKLRKLVVVRLACFIPMIVTIGLVVSLAATAAATTGDKPMLKPSEFAIMPWDGVHLGNGEAHLDQAEIDRRVLAPAKRVGEHKATYGYYLRDEPGASGFHHR